MSTRKLIAVIGATGHQGGGVVHALQSKGQYRVRALTRDPGKHRDLADEVVEADLNRPETLAAAFAGAHGVFAVTDFSQTGTDEITQATAAIGAARRAGVRHFVWSTLPNVEAISGGSFDVPHFTHKAEVDRVVAAAGFEHHSFVMASFFYQNLITTMLPQKQPDGTTGWALPIDGGARGIHMADIDELGHLVAGSFAAPDMAGHGEHLPLVGDLLSFDDIVATLNRQGHGFTFRQVPAAVFAESFPGAAEMAEMLGYFEKHTYFGNDFAEQIALAARVAGKRPTDFASWARSHMPVGVAKAEIG